MFKNNKKIYFYNGLTSPCEIGYILEKVAKQGRVEYRIKKQDKSSIVLNDALVFSQKKECLKYAEHMANNLSESLLKSLTTKEDVIRYMYSCIGSYADPWEVEKSVLRKKIKELFNIHING